MAYFSNGTEGMTYEETYCERCLHYGDEETSCPVWGVHLFHAHEQLKDGKLQGPVAEILSALIPMDPETHEALKCSMFMPNGDCKGQTFIHQIYQLKKDFDHAMGPVETKRREVEVRHWRECPLRSGDESLGCGLTRKDDDCGTAKCLCNILDFDPKCPLVVNGKIVLVRGYKDQTFGYERDTNG